MSGLEPKELHESINEIRENLRQILAAKKEGAPAPIGEKNLVSHLFKLKKMRQKHRKMQIGIEEERAKIRLEKEKIEKTSVFLSGLEYFQSTLRAAIEKCKAVDLKEVSSEDNQQKVNDNNLLHQESDQTHNSKKRLHEDNSKNPNAESSAHKHISTSSNKRKRETAEALESLKEELGEELKKRLKKREEADSASNSLLEIKGKYQGEINQLSTSLHPVLSSLAENMKLLNVVFTPSTRQQLNFNPCQHSLASQLPPPLYSVFSKLSILFQQSEVKSINETLSSQSTSSLPSQISTVDIQPSQQNNNVANQKRNNEFFPLEVVVTIKEFLPSLFNYIDNFFNSCKISLASKPLSQAYPLKFTIKYIPNLGTLVAQFESKILKGKEIFSGLFENDSGTPLIQMTTSEYEKNLNQQYECYNWLQVLGGTVNKGSSTSKVEAAEVIRKINERVVSKRVVKSIVDALAGNTISFIPLLRSAKETISITELSKYKFDMKQRLQSAIDLSSNNLYKKLIPAWLSKKVQDTPDLLEEEETSKPLLEQLNEWQKQSSKQTAEPRKLTRKEQLKLLRLESESNETDVYVFSVSKGDQFAAIFLLSIPLSTLNQIPSVRFVSACTRSTTSTKPQLASIFSKNLIVPCTDSSIPEVQNNVTHLSSGVLSQIEADLSQIGQLIPETSLTVSNRQFALVYQLNRMVSLFEIAISHYQRCQNLSTKSFASTQFDLLDL